MSYTMGKVHIVIGAVDSRLLGPVPVQALDRALNGSLYEHGSSLLSPADGLRARVFDPVRQTVLTGALPLAKALLRRRGIRFRLHDPYLPPRRRFTWALQGVELRDYQQRVVRRALATRRGMIDVGTGGGKTLLAAAIIAELGIPTLYTVTTRALLRQTERVLGRLLGFTPGVIGAGRDEPGDLTVALVQGLRRRSDLARWRDGLLVFDEGHHSAAPAWLATIRQLHPSHAYFLSAVPFRTGDDQAILDALTGGTLTGGAYRARYLIDHGFCTPVQVHVRRCHHLGDTSGEPFAHIYAEGIVDNAARNAEVAAVAGEARRAGGSVLVLVERVRHGLLLRDLLGDDTAFVHGGITGARLRSVLKRFEQGQTPVLVATSQMLSEGVSISGITHLVYAGGLKSKVRVLQAVGRAMRRAPGKRVAHWFDWWDDDATGLLRGHSLSRLRALRAEGFSVSPPREEPSPFGETDPIPPAWTHVPDTNRFVKIDVDGNVLERALCLRPALVPRHICKKCPHLDRCQKGEAYEWSETSQ